MSAKKPLDLLTYRHNDRTVLSKAQVANQVAQWKSAHQVAPGHNLVTPYSIRLCGIQPKGNRWKNYFLTAVRALCSRRAVCPPIQNLDLMLTVWAEPRNAGAESRHAELRTEVSILPAPPSPTHSVPGSVSLHQVLPY